MSTLEALRATAHPIRLRLLSLVTSTAMSAAEAGRELGLSQATASYHLRVLERAGLVDVVEVVRLRGGEAKRYRHVSSAEPFDVDAGSGGSGSGASGGAGSSVSSVSSVSVEDQLAYVDALVEELRRRAQHRADGPALSTDAELWVGPETWRRVVRHVGEASALLHAAAQRPRTPGSVPVSMTVSMFPLRRS